ncbi:LOW QUALITY PROTEIN: prolyl 4-hydroxylase subunit alpha-1-like [Paramacrobiotus metropolitanus]|uniref:LOW QUALITY PROTEIN: prolyl 4-hydroxylase subunit alpha-1-like n=1 Tax=Paramacrobiotus metropolitanus TaxID=2943436 RepID=UPI00244571E8|nr:LOW QUALITY PROTEIN: prolyl 4-hydroxylase subunit alpha-1-like [Paramacrobiotus metropolitanus]
MNISKLFFVSFVFLFKNVWAEVFTSMADVHNLIHTEGRILNILELLIEAEKEKIAAIENYIQQFTDVYELPGADVERLVSHPVNAFLLVKHLSADWENLKRFLLYDMGAAAVRDIEKERSALRFPEEEDIKGAAEGFVRLQRTYKITTEDFASGKIPNWNVTQVPPMSALDCYLIGHRLAQEGVHDYAANWLEISLRKFDEEKEEMPKIRKVDIVDWLQYAYYHGGNPVRALELTEVVRELDPDFPTLESNFKFYSDLIAELDVATAQKMRDQSRPPPSVQYDGHYEALCRGEGKLAPRVVPHLKCYFETHNNPYLLLQPAKFEVAYVDPDIYFVHDVITDNQMQMIKEAAMVSLQRATVVKAGTNETEYAKIRISKSAFLGEHVHPVIPEVNRRIGHVTNFDMNQAEQLQVANYGIGGFYDAHYDFFRNPNDINTKHIEKHLGDRIATLLIYMTDVEAGGATTFPVLNVTLFPQKGSASFWFNLNRDGRGDVRTLHAGCPVLSGNKWVSNKWIREIGQHDRRPCDLVQDSLSRQVPGVVWPDMEPAKEQMER